MKKLTKPILLALALYVGLQFIPNTASADPKPPIGMPLSVEIDEDVNTYNADPKPPIGY